MSSVRDPMTTFDVDSLQAGEGSLALRQHVGAQLTDHRGLVEMPAYAVMAESVTSGAYWYSFREPVATVQAWLAMTAGVMPRVGDSLHAASVLSHRDDSFGIATLTVTNGSGEVVCTGVARAAKVGRTTEALLAIDKDELHRTAEEAAPPPEPGPVANAVPAAIDPEWDGRRILTAISRGDIASGPLCELLAATVSLDESAPVLTVTPQPWMANPLGAIQGGVMASIVGQACSFAGQAHTGPGEGYTLADLSIFYFRSPPVDRGALTLATTTERVGRRLATVSATMSDALGTLYARAVADIAFDRAPAF